MYDYVIGHASFGHPFEHWYSWLFTKLREQGKNVLVPQFPCSIEGQSTKDMQTYANWCRIMDAYRPFISENTSYIAHSIAPAFFASYLADNKMKAKNLFFIAPVYGNINVPDYDYVNSSFFECKDLGSVSKLARNRFCYISRNDPYVPNELSEQFADSIEAEKFYSYSGHFNTAAGFTTFDQLLTDIMRNE